MPISQVFALEDTEQTTKSINLGGTNNFYFRDFTADYYLEKTINNKSKLRVIERFTAVFPDSDQNHGITRDIPFTNQAGENLTMASDSHLDITIKHNGAIEEPYKIEAANDYFRVYIGDPEDYVHGAQTYELEYEFINVITAFSEADTAWQELYWDTNGTGWKQSFGNVTARVHFLGEDIAKNAKNQAWCYVGLAGANDQERCEITRSKDGFAFHATNLNAGENLTFDITFNADTFTIANKQYDFRILIACTIEFIIGAIILVYTVSVWRRASEKRQYYKHLFVKPEYTPLAEYSVAEMGQNYIGLTPSFSKLSVATLMELAVDQKVQIIKGETDGLFKKKVPEWKIRLQSDSFSPEASDVLRILAGDKQFELKKGQEIVIERHNLATGLVQLQANFGEKIRKSLVKKGLSIKQQQPKGQVTIGSKKHTSPVTILGVLCFFWLFLVLVSIPLLLADELPSYRLVVGSFLIPIMILFALAVFVIAIISVLILEPFFTHTKKGLEISRYLDGLKLYIKMAESERIKFLQSVKGVDTSHQGVVNLYEKLLPYAILFDLEASWLDEMGKYYEFEDVSEPNWYLGMGVFSAYEFSSAMMNATDTITSLSPHSSSSSSFSGGGGGGFSGGGGGGGGGGGW